MSQPIHPSTLSRFCGCLLGLALGDAVGTSVEFRPRGSFQPLEDLVGGGPFHLQPGQWTDDTSMALCLATSLVECRGFDAKDQMERYSRWVKSGYLSSTGKCFDIGNTTLAALQRFHQTGDPFAGSTDARASGNGCIMRLAPIPLFYYSLPGTMLDKAAEDSSRTTHGTRECLDASRWLARALKRALQGQTKLAILQDDANDFSYCPSIQAINSQEYQQKSEIQIRGTGYVVQSLEAALWCFFKTENFRDAILKSANLGDDADTTAAICGQIAGAFYGEQALPESWLQKLAMRSEIASLAERLFAIGQATSEQISDR